jgi:hypothetical protein
MSIVRLDGFEDYGSSFDIGLVWVKAGTVTYGDSGRFSGKSLRLSGSSGSKITRGLPSAYSAVSVGVAVMFASPFGSTASFLQFLDVSNNDVCMLNVDTFGALSFVRGSSVGVNVLCTAPAGTLKAGIYQYVEVELVRHASAGSVNIYVNGGLVASASGVNTGANDVAGIMLAGMQSSNSNWDDFYVNNTSTRTGELKIDTLSPTADTAQKDFTASTGSDNYAMVDELPVNADTDYVTADINGNADLYTIGSLSGSPASIVAAQVRVVAKKTDTAYRSLKPKLKSSSTVHDGSAVVLGTSYGLVDMILETDPNTSSAWTATNINAAEIGMEMSTS